jgi:hypothetical protein
MSQIAFFQHLGASGVNVPVQTMLDGIRSGKWEGQIKRLRAAPYDSDEFSKSKRTLPAFMLSATTNSGHKAADVKQHSGLLQLDVDHVGAEHAGSMRDLLGEDRHILAAWISPSGTGIKAIMRIPADVEQHKAAFEAAAEYMRESYGLAIDKACKDVCRLCFVSHDPDLVMNPDAVELQVSGEVLRGSATDNSSTSLNAESYILHNSVLFDDFPNLRPLYRDLVFHRYPKPQRGMRNAAMVEIVATCFCAVAAEFVMGFAVEYYNQHVDVFAGYDFERFKQEAETMLAGCHQSYPQRLSEGERNAYTALGSDREQAAFRIAQSLSKCESDATVPPPLFHLSASQFATRLGLLDMQAWRILRAFEKSGFIQMERSGTVRTKGVQGIATVYRWMMSADDVSGIVV